MVNKNQINHKNRKEIRKRLNLGHDIHDVIQYFCAVGADRVLVENEVFKFNIRQKDLLLSAFLQLVIVYLTAASVFLLAYSIFTDLNKTARALTGFGVIVLFFLSFIFGYKPRKSVAFVIKLMLLGCLLATAVSLLFSEMWQLSGRPRSSFGVLFWALSYIPVWIGPKIIGAITIVLIHLAVLKLYSDYLVLLLLEEANRQTKNFEVMLVSQLSNLKHIDLKVAKRVVPAITNWLKSSPREVGQFPINDGYLLVASWNEDSLQFRCVKEPSESTFYVEEIDDIDAEWAFLIPRTPYFY